MKTSNIMFILIGVIIIRKFINRNIVFYFKLESVSLMTNKNKSIVHVFTSERRELIFFFRRGDSVDFFRGEPVNSLR